MGKYENNICQAVNILVDQAISGLQLDKTVLGTIQSCVDVGMGKYRVKYQDSVFTAYSQSNTKYKSGTKVYVLIPSNDINKDRIIIGTVSKLGEAYISAATAEDRMTKIGSNIFSKNVNFGLCSYKKEDIDGYSGQELINNFGILAKDLEVYKKDAKYIMIAAKFKTELTQEQQIGNGDYGLVVSCKYYNDDTKSEYIRKYTINVPNMIGQPYKFVVPSRQYGLFEAEGDNLVSIESVDVYSRNFPVEKNGKEDDIFITDFEFYFMEALTADEIAGTCLHIATPQGSYFNPIDTTKTLLAEIKIKGSAIDYVSTEDIEYYWFIRDASINAESEKYSPLAGDGWRCLNRTTDDSSALGGASSFTTFIPGVYKINISKEICPSRENRFRCIAVMEDAILYGEVNILNFDYAFNITLTPSESVNFPFETAYNFQIEARIANAAGHDVSDSVIYHWGYEADGQPFEIIEVEDDTVNVLHHDPNIAINVIRYIVTIYDLSDTERLGCAEILFTNTREQKLYNLVMANDTQVFKYNEEGASPTSNSIEKINRQAILPLTFELYDKQSRIVAEKPEEKVTLFKSRWLFPVENTMIVPLYNTEGLPIVMYNGIDCYELKIINTAQLSFNYNIYSKYNINWKNNTIFLEVEYQGMLFVASTNFTFTKEGELGTNGTKYIARIEPQGNTNIQQVIAHNDKLRYWKYNDDGSIKVYEHNHRFNIEIWDGGNSPVQLNSSTQSRWEILPRQSDSSKYNITLSHGIEEGYIDSTNQGLEHATILQGYIISSKLSNLASDYYATYPITVEKTETNDIIYIVTGGYDHVVYTVDGERARFTDILPFNIRAFNINTQTEISLINNDIIWEPSWESGIYTGNDVIIEPPERLEGALDNYILITYQNNEIIWSVHFYFNRYSMAAMNGWDGYGIEVNEDKGYVMTPQLAAGTKNHSNNTFTGIAIGKTFSKSDDTQEIGLFGYKDNIQTIKLDATDGSATFGINDGDHGCLQIIPSNSSTNPDKVSVTSGDFVRATYKRNTGGKYTKYIDVPGKGVEMEFSTNNPHIYFGNGSFEVDKNGNVYLNGTVQAARGYIGGWTVHDSTLRSQSLLIDAKHSAISASTTAIYRDVALLEQLIDEGTAFAPDTTEWNNTINDLITKYGANNSNIRIIQNFVNTSSSSRKEIDVPAVITACNTLIESLNTEYSRWYIKGDGSFRFGSNNAYISFNTNGIMSIYNTNLFGSGWSIQSGGNFSLGDGAMTYTNGSLRINAGIINLNTVNIQYNGVPIQGRSINESSGSGTDIQGWVTGREFPTWVLLRLTVMRYDNGDREGGFTIPNIPNCSLATYTTLTTTDGNEDSTLCRLEGRNFYLFALKKNKYYLGFIVYEKR